MTPREIREYIRSQKKQQDIKSWAVELQVDYVSVYTAVKVKSFSRIFSRRIVDGVIGNKGNGIREKIIKTIEEHNSRTGKKLLLIEWVKILEIESKTIERALLDFRKTDIVFKTNTDEMLLKKLELDFDRNQTKRNNFEWSKIIGEDRRRIEYFFYRNTEAKSKFHDKGQYSEYTFENYDELYKKMISGTPKPKSVWIKELGITYSKIGRLIKNYPVLSNLILNTRYVEQGKVKDGTYQNIIDEMTRSGVKRTVIEWAKELGYNVSQIKHALNSVEGSRERFVKKKVKVDYEKIMLDTNRVMSGADWARFFGFKRANLPCNLQYLVNKYPEKFVSGRSKYHGKSRDIANTIGKSDIIRTMDEWCGAFGYTRESVITAANKHECVRNNVAEYREGVLSGMWLKNRVNKKDVPLSTGEVHDFIVDNSDLQMPGFKSKIKVLPDEDYDNKG